jgi:hypothetical protein
LGLWAFWSIRALLTDARDGIEWVPMAMFLGALLGDCIPSVLVARRRDTTWAEQRSPATRTKPLSYCSTRSPPRDLARNASAAAKNLRRFSGRAKSL